jgi:hypothetical protein
MKVVLTIIGVILVLLMFGLMMGGIKDAQTDSRTDTFSVTTAPAETTADVVLVADLYNDSILEITGLTSDVSTDNALQDSYVSATRTLTVRGLDDDETRTLTVTYRYDALTGDSASTGSFLGFIPIFVIIAVVLILVGGMIAVFSRR